MFICERRILVDQFSAHLDRAGIDHGVLMAGHWRFRPDRQVQVASAQTIERMESLPTTDIVFIDELHACMRKSIINMLASPVSNDGRGLKQAGARPGPPPCRASPVSNDGRGLKQPRQLGIDPSPLLRPSAMTGVD